MRGDGQKKPYRKQTGLRLLEVVEHILANEGLMAVQARRISQDADCSVGTIYNIFGDIDGLILAANERTLVQLGHALEAAERAADGQDLAARLLILADAYLDFAGTHHKRWRAVFEHQLPESRTLPESYAANRRQLMAILEAQLDTTIASPADRSDAAYALLSSVHGIVLLSLDAKLGPSDPARCQRQIRFVVSNIVKSLELAG